MNHPNGIETETISSGCGGVSRCKRAIFVIMIMQIPLWYYVYTKVEISEASTLSFYPIKGRHHLTISASYPPPSTQPPSTTVQPKLTSVATIQSTTNASLAFAESGLWSTAEHATTRPSETSSSLLETTTAAPSECPKVPPKLVGPLAITFPKPPPTLAETYEQNRGVEEGGHYKPQECISRSKVAIIIPYRDRMQHLRYFLHYMHPILQRQQLDYRIYIINQIDATLFNRAKLMNIGFVESRKDEEFECFVFHDVDLILENDYALYACPPMPRHLSVGVDKFGYKLPYDSIFGGVTNLRRDHFEKVNGYPNNYWGWGGEDDDMSTRVRLAGLKVLRYSSTISRYKMISHQREKGNEPNPKRFQQIQLTQRTWKGDGLNTLDYKVIARHNEPLYTNITVDVLEQNRKG